MTPEGNLMRRIMLALSNLRGVVTFRNNSGMAWMGEIVRRDDAKGLLTLRNPRPVSFGLVNGASDIIGWTTVVVTPDMVGRRLAVFTAVEVKTPEGRTTPAQVRFIDNLTAAGGIATVARSVEEATAAVTRATKVAG